MRRLTIAHHFANVAAILALFEESVEHRDALAQANGQDAKAVEETIPPYPVDDSVRAPVNQWIQKKTQIESAYAPLKKAVDAYLEEAARTRVAQESLITSQVLSTTYVLDAQPTQQLDLANLPEAMKNIMRQNSKSQGLYQALKKKPE